jgi:hypothetical protein
MTYTMNLTEANRVAASLRSAGHSCRVSRGSKCPVRGELFVIHVDAAWLPGSDVVTVYSRREAEAGFLP